MQYFRQIDEKEEKRETQRIIEGSLNKNAREPMSMTLQNICNLIILKRQLNSSNIGDKKR